MKLGALVVSLCVALLIGTSWAVAQTQGKPEEAAQKSAETWLALADAGKYDATWDEASSFFKSAVSKDQWVAAIKPIRSAMGAVQARKLASATFTKTLPGAPDGEYVVIKYDTSFEKKASSIETVTVTLDKDGKWRVAGYYIK